MSLLLKIWWFQVVDTDEITLHEKSLEEGDDVTFAFSKCEDKNIVLQTYINKKSYPSSSQKWLPSPPKFLFYAWLSITFFSSFVLVAVL